MAEFSGQIAEVKASSAKSRCERSDRQDSGEFIRPFTAGDSTSAICPLTSAIGSRRRAFGIGNRVIEMKEALDPCHFQCLVDALIDSYQAQTAAILLPVHIGSDQRPYPRRIGERHAGKVENQCPRLVGSDL